MGAKPCRGKPAAAIESVRAKLGFARAVSLDELLADSEIDVVYVASANSAHAAHCLSALRADKAVLCEKPLTLSLSEAEEVFPPVNPDESLNFNESRLSLGLGRLSMGSVGGYNTPLDGMRLVSRSVVL